MYTWNLFATTIYLEAPAGVGFSYADTPAGTHHNDTSTAADNLAAYEVFFKAYPEYATQPFWITGESYAGIYIPSLAYDIVTSGSKINLKGILVGNGCLGNAVGVCGSSPYGAYLSLAQYHGHGFISDKAMNAANAACGDWSSMSPACNRAARAAENEVGPHDVYALYAGMYGECPYGARKGLKPVPRKRAPSSRPIAEDSMLARMIERHGLGNTCTDDDDLTTYLNTPAVVAALHVGVKGSAWEECGGISYNSDIVDERTTIYPTLMAAKLNIVIYNGEADACVPITDNQWWTDSLSAVDGVGRRRRHHGRLHHDVPGARLLRLRDDPRRGPHGAAGAAGLRAPVRQGGHYWHGLLRGRAGAVRRAWEARAFGETATAVARARRP